MQDSPVLFERVADQSENAAGFAMEAAPETQNLEFAGAAFGQPHRRLDGLSAAAVELNPVRPGGVRDAIRLSRATRFSEVKLPMVTLSSWSFRRRNETGMGMAEAADRNPRHEIEVPPAVHIGQPAALPFPDRQLGELRNLLEPW